MERAVREDEPHLGLRLARCEPAGVVGGGVEIGEDRIDLLDQRELGRVALTDERPFGDQRPADAARDGRAHGGEVEVDRARASCALALATSASAWRRAATAMSCWAALAAWRSNSVSVRSD